MVQMVVMILHLHMEMGWWHPKVENPNYLLVTHITICMVLASSSTYRHHFTGLQLTLQTTTAIRPPVDKNDPLQRTNNFILLNSPSFWINHSISPSTLSLTPCVRTLITSFPIYPSSQH